MFDSADAGFINENAVRCTHRNFLFRGVSIGRRILSVKPILAAKYGVLRRYLQHYSKVIIARRNPE
jgi:hypothetical protein